MISIIYMIHLLNQADHESFQSLIEDHCSFTSMDLKRRVDFWIPNEPHGLIII